MIVPRRPVSMIENDPPFLDWQREELCMAGAYDTFGTIVRDPMRHIWLYFCHRYVLTQAIVMRTSPNGRWWSGPVDALTLGATGTWDASEMGVPLVWYEPEAARPWRMFYRGKNAAAEVAIGLATGVYDANRPGGICWERKGPSGSFTYGACELTSAVIAHSGWEIDHGNVFYDDLTNLYFCYWNTITFPRIIYLSTSSDLVTWTEYGAPLAFFTPKKTAGGDWDYDDATHTGNQADATGANFCGFYGRWDKADGTRQYVAMIPSNNTALTTFGLAVYTSPSPYFTQANRTYRGMVANMKPAGSYKIESNAVTHDDTPRIVCADITQNIAMPAGTGREIWCSLEAGNTLMGYVDEMMFARRDIRVHSLSDIEMRIPAHSPKISLAPYEANTVALWLPSIVGTGRDLSGNKLHLRQDGVGNVYANVPIGPQGFGFDSATTQFLIHDPDDGCGSVARTGPGNGLRSVTGPFTIEFRATMKSAPGTGQTRPVLSFSGAAGPPYHLTLYLNGADDGNYTFTEHMTIDGEAKSAQSSTTFTLPLNTQVRFLISRDADGNVRFFKEGTQIGTAVALVGAPDDVTDTGRLLVGVAASGTGGYWNGNIDEIRISNVARYVANYTVAPITLAYKTSGLLYTKVYDFGHASARGDVQLEDVVCPADCTISVLSRIATSTTDVSVTEGDFSSLVTGLAGRYQQFAVKLETTDATKTPSIGGFRIRGT